MVIHPKHDQHEYSSKLVWTGARLGPTSSYQSYSRDFEVRCGDREPIPSSADPHFRGIGSRYNPEELLVAALSGCHLLSYLADCARAGIQVVAYEDEAHGTMAMKDGRVTSSAVTLDCCGPAVAHDAFKAMLRDHAFDAGELSADPPLGGPSSARPRRPVAGGTPWTGDPGPPSPM